MAAGGASFLAFVVISMMFMCSLGHPRPLCSDCGALCGTNCSAEVKTSCSDECSGGAQASCRSGVFQQCTANSMCCSSNGTCTCDCNTVAQSRCVGLGDGYTRCEACMRGTSERCYRTCNDDCNNNCKKKGCHQ
uniref:Uncharacterized protein n=1 Tax=Hordeum vulgare subsp. vulgare TaxID=112509 RepID=A0A8I6XIX2_HORVV